MLFSASCVAAVQLQSSCVACLLVGAPRSVADGDFFASPYPLCQQTPMPLWKKSPVSHPVTAHTRVAMSLLFDPSCLFRGNAFHAYV